MKKILFVASEAVPFMKTGGLADVVGTLPKHYTKGKYAVKVILPNYMCIPKQWKDKMQFQFHLHMQMRGQEQYVGVLKLEHEGVEFYFIDSEYYFNGATLYGDNDWDVEKFAFFSKAALGILPMLDFQPDVIHCHDWQTGLIPAYIDHFRIHDAFYQKIKTIMTIHNLKFQGVLGKESLQAFTDLPVAYFSPDKLGLGDGGASCLKGGLVYADRITTVSDTYAKEIKMPFYGEGLDALLRARDEVLCGIVNGIDYEEYNPALDNMIANSFAVTNVQKEKVKNKLALQAELGLNKDADVMMLGVVSRLTSQKGFDLLEHVLDELCNDQIQLVILGTGEEHYENLFRHYAAKYPDKVSANIYYSEEMSHKIYASCDLFLMPSLFEPCGLSQLMSLRYGTVPLVRETGGLRDTVEPYNEYEKIGTGFGFMNYNAHEMLHTIRYAQHFYYDCKQEWYDIVKRGMKKDFSWKNSAKQYEELYDKVTR